MSFGEFFGKYIGVQGILALGFGVGFIIAPFVGVALPESYGNVAALVFGYYFAKNGAPGLVDLARSVRKGGSNYHREVR